MSELPDYLIAILNTIAEKENLFNFTINTKPGSNVGDNFMGVLFSVVLEGKRRDKNKNEVVASLKLLCKLAPSNPQRRKEFFSSLAFDREAYFYNNVSETFVHFQNEKGLASTDQFLSFPKCYAAIADDEKEQYVIVMEDLRPEGYEMWPKKKAVPFENISLVMKELAKFHSISFVMKDQRPKEFVKYKLLNDILIKFFESENMKTMLDGAFDRAIKALRDPEHKKIYVDLKANTLKHFKLCLNDKLSEKFGVITHGDCWNNNILYRFSKNHKTVEDVCLVDWQIIRYSSPTLDLLYNIFTSTDKKLRDKEYVNLLNLYYDTLCNNIEKMGSDPRKLFTYEEFQNELKRCGNFALLMTPLIIQICVVDANNISNLDDLCDKMGNGETVNDLIQSFSANEQLEFDTRLNDAVTDIINLGYYTKLNNDIY